MTVVENLPVLSANHSIFHSYVCPSALCGVEFVPPGPQLERLQTRVYQWGRRLLKWPRGAPSIAVQGQLGWLD